MINLDNGADKMSRVYKSIKPVSDHSTVLVKRSMKMSVILAAVVVSGCASYQKDHFTVGSTPQDYRTKHPIIVSQSETSEDLVVTSSMRAMSFRHQNIVTDLVGRFKRSGAKTIHVILPAGSHNEAAAGRVASGIVAHIKSFNVDASRIKIERYHAANHGDSATIRLSYGSTGARVASQCGAWNEDLVDTSENINYGNFGCATQNNLAEIIANPEDLLGPRGETEIDAERRDNVINGWRTNGSEPAQEDN